MTLDIDTLNKVTETAIIASSVNTEKLKETDYPTAIISCDTQIVSLENYQKYKNCFKGDFTTNNIDNFVQYNKDQDAEDNKQCFINPELMRATTIFDLGDKEKPGQCKHKAFLRLEKSVDYESLLELHIRHHSQKELSEFIEDWSDNITCFSSNSGELKIMENKVAIQLIRNVTIASNSNKTSEVGDYEGKQSTFESVEAKSKDGLDLPSRIEFKCKPYDDLSERFFMVRISMLTGENKPIFSFRVINLDSHSVEMAKEFQAILTSKLDDGMKTYIGDFVSK